MAYFRDFSGNHFITENGGIGWRRNPWDGHGGHGAEHRQEMMQIAEQVASKKIAEAIPEIQKSAYSTAYSNLIEALSFDVSTAVEIAFQNGASIFHDKKTQKVIADSVMNELRKQFKKYT